MTRTSLPSRLGDRTQAMNRRVFLFVRCTLKLTLRCLFYQHPVYRRTPLRFVLLGCALLIAILSLFYFTTRVGFVRCTVQ